MQEQWRILKRVFYKHLYGKRYKCVGEPDGLPGSERLRVRILADKALNVFNHVVVADEEGTTLVEAFRHDVQNTLFTVARLAARLFGQERHWVAFVQQAQLSVRVAGGTWVEVDTAFQQVTVEIRDQ